MTIEQFRLEYPNLPDHEFYSAYNCCPWHPECDRGQAYMKGYLERAFSIHMFKDNGDLK